MKNVMNPRQKKFVASFLFCRLQNEKWMNVRVGDIIKLENNQFVAVSVSF